MKLQPIPLFGIGNTGKSVNVNAQERLNLYAEVVPDPEKGDSLKFYPTPGQQLFINLGANAIRGLWEVGGVMYAVCGPSLYSTQAARHGMTRL